MPYFFKNSPFSKHLQREKDGSVACSSLTSGLPLLAVLFLFLPCYFASQNLNAQQPVFQNFTVGDGLSSSEVYCVAEGKNGYLWFGTDNGIVRYDGYDFRVYDEADGLNGLVYFTLIFGPDDALYAMGKNCRLHYLPPGAEKFRPHPMADQFLRQCQFSKLYPKLWKVDGNGNLLMSGCGKGYFRLLATGEVVAVHDDVLGMVTLDLPTQCPQYASGFMAFDSAYYFQTTDKDQMPLNFMNGLDGRVIFTDTLENYLANRGERSAFIHRAGQKSFYAAFNDGTLRTNYQVGQPPSIFSRTRHDYSPRFYQRSKTGGFFLAYHNNAGLYYYPDFQDLVRETGQVVLKNVDVSWVHEDRQGGLWVATLDRGILYAANPNCKRLGLDRGLRFPKVVEILPDGRVSCLTQDQGYWLSDRGVDRHDIFPIDWPAVRVSRRLSYQPKQNLLLADNFFVDMEQERMGYYDYSAIITKSQSYYGSFINEFLPLHPDTLLIAGRNGLLTLALEGMQVSNATDSVVTLLEDISWGPSGEIILVSSFGASRVVGRDLVPFLPGQPLLRRPLTEIELLPDSSLLFAGRDVGVLWWWGDSLWAIDETEGLVDNGVRDLFLDEEGIVWVSTFSGLSRIEFYQDSIIMANEVARGNENRNPTFQISNFTVAHGLPTNEVYQARKRYGELWLATSGGLVNFVPPELDTSTRLPLLPAVYVNDSLTGRQDLMQLSPKQNNLRFQFITIDPALKGQINYRYRLCNDADWKYTQQREVNYLALPSGSCYFEVQSQNRGGLWSRSAKVDFTIATVWHQRPWVQLLMSLTILALLFAIAQRQHQRIKKEAAMEKQLSELERSALQAQMNPHFIFNCLNSINQFILSNDAEQASLYLSRFARLIRQALNASVEGKHALIDEMNMLANYLELEKLRFKNRFEYSIDLDEQLDEYNTKIPSMLVQPFVENALLHGLSERKKNGLVNIRLEQAEGGLKVIVIDNGKGFNDGKTKQHKQQSLGMSVTRKRLEILAKSNEKAVISVFTLKDKNERPRGTRVEILIRLRTTTAK